ncbi:hypothetical protein J3R83DRAFT_9567 [Lanmaoa asiatica]|nr:hypothetical protein J3R83DRAFT_9567 [Lanmaoa asiatica]
MEDERSANAGSILHYNFSLLYILCCAWFAVDMSLLKWSTPQRRRAGQILPIVPNEIYLYILEFIAPPIGRLTPEELEIFTNLSRVCRFFANFCLPRSFEFLEFSGTIFRDDTPTVKALRAATLCTEIAAKQPLALSLAKRVRICHFTNWDLDDTGSWAVRLFTKKYTAGVLHMENIRELNFSASFVDAEHWSAIATLESLEKLSFDSCRFLQGPADVASEKRIKVKVSCLRVTNCTGHRQPVAAIDHRYLRTLTMDYMSFDHVHWLPQSALTELRFCYPQPFCLNQYWCAELVHAVLTQAPRSVEALWLSVDVRTGEAQGVRSMFDDPAWRDLPLLRSLTLQVCPDSDTPANVLSFVLECITLLTGLQSLTLLKDHTIEFAPAISPTEVRRILHDKLGPTSSLRRVEIYERAFCLVGGEWSEVSRTA